MRQVLLGIAFLYASLALGQTNSFSVFLSQLKEIDQVDILAFGDTVCPSSCLDVDKFHQFLPQSLSEQEKVAEHIWCGGGYQRKGKVVVAYLQVFFPDFPDGYSKWFVENTAVKYMIATYTLEGKLIDSRCVGMKGWLYSFSVSTVGNDILETEQQTLSSPLFYYEYTPILSHASRRSLSISSRGKIRSKELGERQFYKENPWLKKCPPLTFSDFLKRFKRWKSDKIDKSIFESIPSDRGDLSSSLLNLIPDTILCKTCYPAKLLWTPCHYIECSNSIFCFMEITCEVPRENSDDYYSKVVAEFDKEGDLKMWKTVSRISRDGVEKVDKKSWNAVVKLLQDFSR